METTKHKVGRVLLIITLIIAFLGCMLMAITLPFLSTVGVASADSSNGIVEDNIDTDGDLDNNEWFVNTTSISVTMTESNNLNFICPATSTYTGQQLVRHNITYGFTNTSYTVSFYVSSMTGTFRLRILNGNTNLFTTGISSTGVFSYTFTLSSSYSVLGFAFLNNNLAVNTTIDWFKVEQGSSFTGYVPKDYSNFGYNQGLEEGYNNEFDLRNYRLLDPFSYSSSTSTNINFPSDHYSSSFTFDNKRFGVSTYYPVTSLVPTAYNNLCPFYTLYSSTTTYYNGIKYTNDLLSGDILITFPFRFANNDFDIMFCFEDTVTGSLNYVTSKDSLHWFWGDVIGSTYGSYQVFTCQVHYYSANPVNLYVFQVGLNPVYNTTDIDVIVTRAIWFPLDCIWANIYATSTGSPLNDFDAGYDKGYDDGINSVNTDSYFNYGYRQGYSQGHTDGVAEYQDYTFLGLISAVIDAPVKAFSGLLEFEILGINLKNFVLGLLTLAVIIIIIKIALGGK